MNINPDGTITIDNKIFFPRWKIRSLCDVRWLEYMQYPEIYGGGGVWLPLEESFDSVCHVQTQASCRN